MSRLDHFLPAPRHAELDHVDVAVPVSAAYRAARELDLGRSPVVRALFWARTVPERLGGREAEPLDLRLDAITGHSEGFRLLEELPGQSFTVGAIGRFWKPDIEWGEVAPDRFAAFAEPGWGKIAWQLRVEPRGEAASRITVELRIGATDDESWTRFRRYYALIGPFSHLIRRHMLAMLQRELGLPEVAEQTRPLPGDELIPEARAMVTHGIDLAASPEAVWPWLVQMGCRRAGWYSHDWLDNGGVESARELHPEWQHVQVGDVLPASPEDPEGEGFRVLRVDEGRALVLGGTFDQERKRLLREDEPLPGRYWRATWAFVLEPIDAATTRLHVRARVDFAPERLVFRAMTMGIVHHFMESAQLRHLKERVERAAGTAPDDAPRGRPLAPISEI
jgi:hypothetical protein